MTDQHFLIYKPYRMVSQFITNDNKQKRKRFLGELGDFPDTLMAVGRLDENSEGLLLLTTNGKLSDDINRSTSIDKEYYVQLDGSITDTAIDQLCNGVTIGIKGNKYKTKTCQVTRLLEVPVLPPTLQRIRDDRHGPTSWIRIVLHEGKYRQIRKMTSAVGYPTLRLARVGIGYLGIHTLKGNSSLQLSEDQMQELFLNND